MEFRRKNPRNSSKTFLKEHYPALTLQVKKTKIIHKQKRISTTKTSIYTIMKKLLAIVIMYVLTTNVAIAQSNHHRMMMRHHFETLDSAAKSHFMKMQKDSWEKQMKKNDKKWKKQMAFYPMMGSRWMNNSGFKFQFQSQEQTAQFVGGKEALS